MPDMDDLDRRNAAIKAAAEAIKVACYWASRAADDPSVQTYLASRQAYADRIARRITEVTLADRLGLTGL